MQQASLEKIIQLINKTGDRLVVIDSNSSSPFVIMSIRDYERLALNHDKVKDLTEDELLNKINRDIAIWKSNHDEGEELSFSEEELRDKKCILNFNEKFLDEDVSDEEVVDDDKYYFEPLED